MCRLTWPDLIVEDVSADDVREWLLPWSGVIAGEVAPAFMSKFGMWFLRRPEGHVEMLDVFSGEVVRVAETYSQFVAEVNEMWWQEIYLLSELIDRLHRAGKVAGQGQSYALAPHPAIGGRNPMLGESIEPEFVLVMDMSLWQNLCVKFVLGAGA